MIQPEASPQPATAPKWVKSSHSYANGNCVEVAWRKSSHSAYNGNCVEWAYHRSSRSGTSNCTEVALRDGTVLVRDSKDPDGPVLELTPRQWRAFVGALGSPRHKVLRVRGGLIPN